MIPPCIVTLLDSTLMGISGTDTHQSRRSVNTPENHYTRRRTRKLFPIGYRKGIVLGKEKQDGTCQQAVSSFWEYTLPHARASSSNCGVLAICTRRT